MESKSIYSGTLCACLLIQATHWHVLQKIRHAFGISRYHSDLDFLTTDFSL